MNINYVAYLDPFHFSGGGEMIMRDLLEYAINDKYKINITSIKPFQKNYDPNADLTILCDIFNEPKSWKKMDNNFIEDIIQNMKYIHFDNSYVDSCDLDYLPCNGYSEIQCNHKSIFNLESNVRRKTFTKKCFHAKDLIQKMYKKSICNVFLSPLHYRKISSMLKIESRPYFILKPTVDTNKFFNMNLIRDIDYIFAGVISEAKGVENLKKYFEGTNKRLMMLGKNIYGTKLPFAEYIGFIPYDEIPKYFNRAKNFIYLPRWPEAQGRVVVEAALCGCNLITNENVGATSFNFDISDKNNVQNAVNEFWNYINNFLGDKCES